MRRLLFTLLVVVGLGLSAPLKSEPIGKGILGATEQQVAAKLGAPDEKETAVYAESGKKPQTPVVKVLVYSLKDSGLAPIAIGFDAKGVARSAEFATERLSATTIQALCSLIATDWAPEKDMSKTFPPLGNQQLVFQGLRIPGIKIWETSSRGKNEIFPFRLPAGVAQWGIVKHVAACKERTAYAVGDVRVSSSREPSFEVFFIADADTFWTWTFDGFVKLFKEGWPKFVYKVEPGKSAPKGPQGYDAEFFYRGEALDSKVIATRLLSAAIVELVRNPAADLAPARPATALVNERYDQALSPALAKLLQNENQAIRDRAAMLVGHLDDPILIEPLIAGLGGKLPVAAAAQVLQKTTGQELGADPAAWKQWFKDNRKVLQDGYAQRKSARAGDQAKVAVVFNGKYYHVLPGSTAAPTCPNLARAIQNDSFQRITPNEARKRGLQPCARCNPVK